MAAGGETDSSQPTNAWNSAMHWYAKAICESPGRKRSSTREEN